MTWPSMVRRSLWISAFLLALFAAGEAQAHRLGESYLYLQVYEDTVTGRFEISLKDLNEGLGRVGTDEEITPQNLEEYIPFLKEYYLEQVGIYHQDDELEILYGEYDFLAGHSGYVLLPFELGGLDGLPQSLTFDYNVLFDEHPSHLAFLLVEYNWATGVFANESGTSLGFLPDDRRHTFELAAPNRLVGLFAVVRLGMGAIWGSVFHMFFLLALLLPTALRREKGGWAPVEDLGTMLRQVGKIFGVYAAAHSFTLLLAALGLVRLPERLLDVMVALSIVVVAADLLVPLFKDRRVWVVLGFGLFHGFAFGEAVAKLGVMVEHPVLALFAFLLGLEIGHLVLVALAVTALFLVRRLPLFPKLVLPAVAMALILIALVWTSESAFGIDLPLGELLPPAIQEVIP